MPLRVEDQSASTSFVPAERETIHVCKDCGGRAHCYDRCPADRRRKWTQTVPVEYVRADTFERAMAMLLAAVLEVERLGGSHDRIIAAGERVEVAGGPGASEG